MAKNEVRVTLVGDDKSLTSTIKGVGTDIDGLMAKVQKLGNDPAQILLKSNGEQIARQIADLIKDVDKLDAADPEVDVKIKQINSLYGDLEKIKGKLVEIGDTSVDIDTSRARRAVGEVGKSADSSKSALANMVGNTVQDLGDLTGIAGSAGVAVGQMGEYFADATLAGEGFASTLASFGLVAVPIAALSVAVPLLTSLFGGMSEQEKIAEQATKDLTEAFISQGNTVETLNDSLTKFLQGNPELVSAMNALGISARDFRDEMVGGANPAVEDARKLWAVWQTEIEKWGTSNQQNTEGIREMAEATGISEDSLRVLLPQLEAVISAVDGQAEGYKNANKAAGEYQHAIEGLDGKKVNVEIVTRERGLAEIMEQYQNLRNKTVYIDFRGNPHVNGTEGFALNGANYAGAGIEAGSGLDRAIRQSTGEPLPADWMARWLQTSPIAPEDREQFDWQSILGYSEDRPEGRQYMPTVNLYGVTIVANDPESLVKKLKEWTRKNGPLPVRTL